MKRFVALILVLGMADAARAATTRGSFDRAPFYDGKGGFTPPVAYVPIAFRTESGSLDPTPEKSPALGGLLDSLATEIPRMGSLRPLPGDVGSDRAPDIRFGVRRGGTGDDGMPRAPTEVDTREPRRMAFEVEGPSKQWRERVRSAAGDSIGAVIVVQLGFDEYWVRQASWKGNKAIELGTGRSTPVAWLTSLDDPVQVLQLTGALMNRDGKILRVGAEGLIARRTGMTASVAGVQEILTEDDLAALFEAAPGQAPVWRTALRSLVEGLLAPSR
jgi:hypothetical protein